MADPVAAPTLEDLGRELTIQKMKNAMLEVRLSYPTLPEKLLSFYQGPPDGLVEYAKNLHQELANLTPAPTSIPAPTVPAPEVAAPSGIAAPAAVSSPSAVVAPAPAPGPGAGVTPDIERDLRLKDFRQRALDKQLDVKGFKSGRNEAEEYFGLAMGSGLRRTGLFKERAR